MRTFLDVFPHATLWLDGNLMVGSTGAAQLDPATLEPSAPIRAPRRRSTKSGLRSFDDAKLLVHGGPDEMRRFVGPGIVLTDDRPLLEYHRSLRGGPETLDLSTLRGDINSIID